MQEHGIFRTAQQAAKDNKEAEIKEEIALAILDLQTEELSKGNVLTLDILYDRLVDKLGGVSLQKEEGKLKGEYKGYNFNINSDFQVEMETNISNVDEVLSIPIDGLVDYWPLKTGLRNVVGNTEMIATGTPNFENECMNLTGEVSIATKDNYIFNNTGFTVALQVKGLTRYNEARMVDILAQGKYVLNSSLNFFAITYDNYYPCNRFFVNDKDTDNNTNLNFFPSDSNWHTFVIKYDGINTSFYYDGNKKVTLPGFEQIAAVLRVGGFNTEYGGYGYINGDFRNLAIYNKSLNENEISSLFENE